MISLAKLFRVTSWATLDAELQAIKIDLQFFDFKKLLISVAYLRIELADFSP